MNIPTLLRRNLVHYWRTNLAVVAGVAATVAVLAGALLVGDSVRASLAGLVRQRLGNAAFVIASDGFFRENLAAELQSNAGFRSGFAGSAPLITLEGVVTHEKSGRRASGVQVYGVDHRFWEFHGIADPTGSAPGNIALISPALAEEFSAAPGDNLLVRVQKPNDVPVDSLHGRKDDLGRTFRASCGQVLAAEALGEFSLRPQQGAVRTVFVPLRRLQRDLQQENKVNTIMISQPAAIPATRAGSSSEALARQLTSILKNFFSLADLGLHIRPLGSLRAFSLESEKILLDDRIARAALTSAAATFPVLSGDEEEEAVHSIRFSPAALPRRRDVPPRVTPFFTYLATSIRIGSREIPYSLVTSMDGLPRGREAQPESSAAPPIWLNQWAMQDLAARPGETVTLEYYVWNEGGRLEQKSAQFSLRGAVEDAGIAPDRDMAPQFPGITESESLGDWDPPFSIDLKRVRPRDEAYWKKFRATPKAFLPLDVGRQLWRSHYGQLTSLRITPPGGVSLSSAIEAYEKNLRATLDPSQSGLAVIAVRADSEAASQGAVNFGEYFLYFSFFLVVSAVLLTGLFFKLGVEQRLREIGLLRAIGFDTARLASIFLVEGFGLAVLGTAAGLLGALAYAALMTLGLRTWWIGAVGTRLLRLHVSAASLILGSTAGILTAQLCILWTLRGLRRFTSRALLHGESGLQVASAPRARRGLLMAGAFTAFGLLTLLAAALGRIPQVAAFFSIGVLMLSTLLCIQWVWLARGGVSLEARSGLSALSRLGFRNATWRPGRSLLCISLMASATFIIVAVDSFRRTGPTTLADRKSGTGGYELLAESLLPVAYDLNSTSAQQSLNFSAGAIAALRNVRIDPFRVRPGDDASCLNLYLPRNPRILGVPSSFIQQGRFAFQQSLARTREEKSNPWLLLDANPGDGAIPAIADANSLTYNLHLKVGEEFVFNAGAARPIRLRIVAALSDSLFQRELLISEQNFLSLFAADPAAAGFHFFLLDLSSAAGGSSRAAQVSSALESSLSDFGFDASSAADRLAAFHRVENTYLSTFQALGGLGLLLGTFGLAAVLLRNILERRRELALLRAVGYRPADLAWLVVAENAWLLFAGLGTGVASALVAVTPVLLERGSRLPALSLAALLSEVLVVGLLASLVAVAAVVRMPLLPVLRAE